MKRSGIRGFIGNKGTISRIPLRCVRATNFKLHLAVSIYVRYRELPTPILLVSGDSLSLVCELG